MEYTIDNLNEDADVIRNKYAGELSLSETRIKLVKKKIKDEMEACREKFYDSSLVDKNGEPLRIGDSFLSEGEEYYVTDRYNQVILYFLNNPRLVCLKQKPNSNGFYRKKFYFRPVDATKMNRITKTISQVVDEHLERCEKT